jgi:hypothetical protein
MNDEELQKLRERLAQAHPLQPKPKVLTLLHNATRALKKIVSSQKPEINNSEKPDIKASSDQTKDAA